MGRLNTLTVQDVLWINFLITKRTVPFDYARLEEASFCQFGYGGSMDILLQGARLLRTMAQRKPFTEGNVETALVTTAAFLRLNGLELTVDPAQAISWAGAFDGDTLENHARPFTNPDHGDPDIRGAISLELRRYSAIPNIV